MNVQQRDVLVGVLAHRLGLSTADELAAAQADTVADRARSISDALVARGALSASERKRVEALGAELAATTGDDLRAALAVVGGDTAVAESFDGTIAVEGDGAITRRERGEGDEAQTVTAEHPGRYSVGKRRDARTVDPQADTAELGRGGIGRVLVAFDEHLGREVAMKELLPKAKAAAQGDPRLSIQTTRFLREARVTGQLEHPNIIPVYELGRRADGALYYTMKIVRGRDLAEALAGCRSLEDRLRLLKHFADLCDAMAYAHSRGVVHRDLKPDNVMVGEFGETVVLDWGLAKPADGQDLRGHDLAQAIAALKDSELAKTADGTLLGTPLYMSPEQAQGALEQVDARSDVYSLGAMLYQLLTGSPPFSGDTTVDLLLNVVRGPLTPVRERCPEAPAELAAIAEKALSRDRDARYADARALAEEVRAYLTGGRVGAHAYSARELLGRWARRHKVALAVAGVALALLVTLGVFSWVNIVGERNRALAAESAAVAAQSEAEAAGVRATEARDGAEGLVRFMVGDLRDRLEPLGQIALLDAVVDRIDGYYRAQGQAGGAADDAARARGKAATLTLLADIQAARGELEGADRSSREALTLRRGLVDARGDATEPALLRELGESQRQVAAVRVRRGDVEGGEAAYREAIATLGAAATAAPGDDEAELALSEAQLGLGATRATRGDLPGAQALFREAIAARRAIVARTPEPRWRYELTLALDRLGHALLDSGDLEGAAAAYQDALSGREALVRERPGNLGWRHDLAASHQLVGDVALERGDEAAAREAFLAAAREMERLAAADPLNRRWQRDLAVSLNRSGDLLVGTQPAQALEAYRRALGIMTGLAARDEANAGWRRDLEVGHNRVGRAHAALGERAEARAAHESALSIARALVDGDGDNATWTHDLAVTLMSLGALEADARQAAAAKARYGEAKALLEGLVARDATRATWSQDLARATAALVALAERDRPRVTEPDPQRQRAEPAALEMAPPARAAPQRQRAAPKPLRQRPSTKRGDNAAKPPVKER